MAGGLLGDGLCQDRCNVAACAFDQADCSLQEILPQGLVAAAVALGVGIAVLLVLCALLCACCYLRRQRERYAQLESRFNELARREAQREAQRPEPASKPGVLISPAEQAARLRKMYFSGKDDRTGAGRKMAERTAVVELTPAGQATPQHTQ